MVSALALLLACAPANEIAFPGDSATSAVPARFRLAAHTFAYELKPRFELPQSGIDVFALTFPSPVASPYPANNTVHAEYFVPKNATGIPAVVVLDILDGRQTVARAEAVWLAQNGIGALVVYMAYYGPRRPEGEKVRLLSMDIDHSVNAITQTALDCRRAAAWLAARPEVDASRLGLLGTSLGSLIGGVAAAAEPRFHNVCLLLGGGGLVDAFWSHPKATPITSVLPWLGVGKEKLRKLIAPADPLTYAETLKGRHLLLVGASQDEVVPPSAMRALWEATGRPKILWVESTHVGSALYIFPTMRMVIEHLHQK